MEIKRTLVIMLGVLFIAGFMLGFASASRSEKIAPDLQDMVGSDSGEIELAVHLVPMSREDYDSFVEGLEYENVQKFYPEGFIAKIAGNDVNSLAERDEIVLIEKSFAVIPSMQDAVVITKARSTWSVTVQNIMKKIKNADKRPDATNLTGVGQTIAILDTGVDFTHPDLANKNALGGAINLDCYNYSPCMPITGMAGITSHGTNVAGIAAADGNVIGIARGAKIVSLKVSDNNGSYFPIFAINRAINWVIANSEQYNISVVSFSGASGPLEGYCDSAVPSTASLVNSALSKKISFVASTGNGFSTRGIGYPSCLSGAIPVAATNKEDVFATYSNYNSLVRLFAPGTSIYTTNMNGGYVTTMGTSMSAPMVSGAIAIMNQFVKAQGISAMDPKKIETELYEGGDAVLGLPYPGARRINIFNTGRRLDESGCYNYFGPAVC